MKIDYVRSAAAKKCDVKDIILEEKATMYLQWLVVPSSSEIGRHIVTSILKDARFEIKKLTKVLGKQCNKIDIMMAGDNGGTHVLEIYDDMLTEFRKSISTEEDVIRDCANEFYEGCGGQEILTELLFAYVVNSIHSAVMRESYARLSKIGSILDFSKSVYALEAMSDTIYKLGVLLEKKHGVTNGVFSTIPTREYEVIGMSDAIGDYLDRLIKDEKMHEKIQTPLAEYNKNDNALADDIGGKILLLPISELGINSDVFRRYKMKTIQDLYDEEGLRKDLDWSEKEREKIVGALQTLVKKRVLNYV